MLIKSRILQTGMACFMAFAVCHVQNAFSAEDGNAAVAATVNGTPISASYVDLMVKQRAEQGQQDSPAMRKQIIDNLVLQELVLSEAVKKGLDKTPETVDQIALVRESIIVNAFVVDYMKNETITDDMLKAEYDKAKAANSADEYKARHILVSKESDAKSIIAKLKKNPKSFAALAKTKSIDPVSKVNGGDLGWFDPHAMVPQFGEAVVKLEKGKFTEEPVKTKYGYHVILLEDTRHKEFAPLAEVQDQVKQQLLQQNLKQYIDDLRKNAKIDIPSAEPVAVAQPQAEPAAPAAPTTPAAAPAAN